MKWLKVPHGQLTFDVEGNDLEDQAHPLHKYFSRIVHWPGGASGITIGRGYDLGQRPNPETDLTNAGIEDPLKSWLIRAKGLSGLTARDYMNAAPDSVRKQKITRRQQYELFTPIYEYMKGRVIEISNSEANVQNYGKLEWSGLNHKIQDIAVDLIYRGDYHPVSRRFFQEPFVNNDLAKIKDIMSDEQKWSSVPPDRLNRRKIFIKE